MEVTLDFRGGIVKYIEIDGIDTTDYPDFCDAYVSDAYYEDGTPLTDEEMEMFNEQYWGIASELAFDYIS